MKYLLLTLSLLAIISSCTTPPSETVRAFQTQTPALAPLPTTSAAAATLTSISPTSLPLVIKPSATPTPEPPWRFVVLGDTRTEGLDPPDIMRQIVDLARAQTPDVTLAVGDLINAKNDQASVREQWKRWRAATAPLASTASSPWLLVTPGNHDVQGNSWATSLMVEAFPELPDNGPAGLERLAYRFDYRGVRFISIHTEIFGDPHRLGDAQLAWLEQQLKDNPNRYTIVFGHDPAFPIGPHIGNSLDVYPTQRDAFWALLRQYQVTAYICGHEHLYNRQNIEGVTQLVIGTSGSFPYSGFGGDFYHYLAAEVTPENLNIGIYDGNGKERDRFLLQAR